MAQKLEYSLNLRGVKFQDLSNLQDEVELELDRFLTPFLTSKSSNRKITIVVGRGLNSTRLIEGKNPLRFYTEQYLQKLGMNWRGNVLNPGIIELSC